MVKVSMPPSAYLGDPLLCGELRQSSTQSAAAGDGCAQGVTVYKGSVSFSVL